VLVGEGQSAHDVRDARNGLGVREPEETVRLRVVELLESRDDVGKIGPGQLGMAGGGENHRHRRCHIGVGPFLARGR
jgi:hypothetical protein